MNTGVMASMKKAFVGDAPTELVDPYVQVSFAGKMVCENFLLLITVCIICCVNVLGQNQCQEKLCKS